MKQGARYLRFSSDNQSALSIERQDMDTARWMKINDIHIRDTFTDDGYSAKTFDRPDMARLMDYIRQHAGHIDYLVVAELTRFSRILGDAVNTVTMIQNRYGLKIVSAGRGVIYDVNDSASFFMMSLEFLLGHSENLKRESDINGGIYTAKAKEGRYIGAKAPFGYKKEGKGRSSRLVIDQPRADIVRFIFRSFLQGTPVNAIGKEARKIGYPVRGNSVVHNLLSNPVYTGQQLVKPWKDHPGGIFPATHPAIIDIDTWQEVQRKKHNHRSPGISLSDELPLRGVLRCHCSQPLTGAPSRGKLGRYYYYYKCKHSKHLNLSAIKAHEQLLQVFSLMNLSEKVTSAIRLQSEKLFKERTQSNQGLLISKQSELHQAMDRIESLEAKYLDNKIGVETYQRWYRDLISSRTSLQRQIEKLKTGKEEMLLLLQQNIERFTDIPCLYKQLTTAEKQAFIRLVFDNQLSWSAGTYRTPYVIPAFLHNELLLRRKKLLIIEKEKGFLMEIPVGGASRITIEPLLPLISLISNRSVFTAVAK